MRAEDKQWFDSYEVQGRQVSQSEANYNPLGMSSDKGCANCRWFIGPGACVLVSGDISPTGISDYWMAPAGLAADVSEVKVSDELPDSAFLYNGPLGRRWAVKDADGTLNQDGIAVALAEIPSSELPTSIKTAVLTRARAMGGVREGGLGAGIRDMITNFIELVRGTNEVGNVIGLKEVDGRTRFMCTYTNCFKDKERSIFSTAAHKSYEQWVERTQAYPELWIWHTPGTRLGVADWVAETDGLLFASGFIDEGQELRAYRLASEKDLAMSHGYLYGNVENGVIQSYRSYEMSLLPRAHAANEATTFQLLGEKDMSFTQAHKAYLIDKGLYTAEEVAQLEAGAAEFREHMQKLGVDMKNTEAIEGAVEADTEMQQLIKGQAAMVTAVTALAKGLQEVQTQVVSADEKATAAQKSLDDAVADNMQAQVAKLPQGVKATEDAGNVVAEKEAEADLSWFNQAMGSIASAAGIGGK
jgi:hypothetical protein